MLQDSLTHLYRDSKANALKSGIDSSQNTRKEAEVHRSLVKVGKIARRSQWMACLSLLKKLGRK